MADFRSEPEYFKSIGLWIIGTAGFAFTAYGPGVLVRLAGALIGVTALVLLVPLLKRLWQIALAEPGSARGALFWRRRRGGAHRNDHDAG